MNHLKLLIREVPDYPKPGINFYDITTLLKDAEGLREVIDALGQHGYGQQIDRVVGILKAYTTRVGSGPFPTELHDEMGEYLRKTGGEVGVTTGRLRRCGWFDALIARYATRVNGITDFFLTKLDVLSSLERVPICVAYEVDGERCDEVPMTQTAFHHARPIYEYLDGWTEDISAAREFSDLPEAAQRYVLRLEEISGVRISSIGVGAGREATIVRHDLLS